ncbi:MAG: S9 family peptidase [Myxococcaceae bacterium]|nr:S9 family peptidase [Myxococcaceae bacterium]
MFALLVAVALAQPVAERRPVTTALHGKTLTDDWAWLKQKGTPEVEAHLKAENGWTASRTKHLAALEDRLYEEMVARIKETDSSVPYRRRGWLYYSRTEAGREQSIFCRKRPDGTGEVVLLDLNQLRGEGAYVTLGAVAVSRDDHLLAYTLDRTGTGDYQLFIDDLRTKKTLKDTAANVRSLAWAADDKTLFYVTTDAAKRPCRLWRHKLGTKPVLVTEERDERFDVAISLSSDEAWLILDFGSATTNEARALEAAQPVGRWRTVLPRKPGLEGGIDHANGNFFIYLNDTGRNFRFVKVDGEKRVELIAQRDDVMLDEVLLFRHFYVAFERTNALPQLRVVDWATNTSTTMTFDAPVFNVWADVNVDFEATSFRYGYSSMVTPSSIFERSLKTGEATLLKQQPVLGGYDAKKYAQERLWVTAPDGARVPVSLAYRKDRPKDGKGALLLDVYGAYGVSNDVDFDAGRVSLLDRGVALAVAHVRGGGELGKPWHDAGRMQHKRNTFTDLIAVAEALVAQKLVAKDRLVVEGASAGGLTVGAAINLRPDLFKAVIAEVPFVDVINTMLDTSLPLTAGELEEWGDPKQKAAFELMLSYSPYDNVEKKAYPAMLVTSAYNDPNVGYWEPTKWVQKLRAMKTDTNEVLLKVDLEPAGHGGKSGRYELLREEAFVQAYALWQMGIAK